MRRRAGDRRPNGREGETKWWVGRVDRAAAVVLGAPMCIVVSFLLGCKRLVGGCWKLPRKPAATECACSEAGERTVSLEMEGLGEDLQRRNSSQCFRELSLLSFVAPN